MRIEKEQYEKSMEEKGKKLAVLKGHIRDYERSWGRVSLSSFVL